MRFTLLCPLFALACSSGLSATKGPLDSGGFPQDAADDTTDDNNGDRDNTAPVADAGSDITELVAEVIELDGSASYDADGDDLDYEWQFLSIPPTSLAELYNATRADATFWADKPGVYELELLVDDGEDDDADTMVVTIEAPNEGPVANAGQDKTVTQGNTVTLDGSSSFDPDGDPLVYTWELTLRPSGSVATLNDSQSVKPSFVADATGFFIAELTVSDGISSSLADEVWVTVEAAGDGGCLSCAGTQSELERRIRTGDLTSAAGFVFLPLLIAGLRRRSDR